MARYIDDNAVVHPSAEIDDDVYIGPFCVIGPTVRIGRGTKLYNNVTVMGRVQIGQYNEIYPGTVIGAPPQDLSYQGEETCVIIGDHNIIRECVTINRGSSKEQGITRIGNHNLLMACCHVAHDCVLGDHIVITNGTLLGGHVHVEDYAILSGSVAVHHYATIGRFSFVGGDSGVRSDVPPYILVDGRPAKPRCVNIVALKRHNFPPQTIRALSEAFRLLYRAKVGLQNAREILRGQGQLVPEVEYLLDFVARQGSGKHGRAREQLRKAA